MESKSDSPVTEATARRNWSSSQRSRARRPAFRSLPKRKWRRADIPAHDDTYFLVDPLDGTKEFVRGGDDYTVNIGLIENRSPQARRGVRAGDGAAARRDASAKGLARRGERARGAIATRSGAARRRLRWPRSRTSIRRPSIISKQRSASAVMSAVGSSLKFCIVAEGKADIYPRASPTSEWDTAAGHAVLLAAGGLVDGPDGGRLATASARFSTVRLSRRQGGSRRGSSRSSAVFGAAGNCRKDSRRSVSREEFRSIRNLNAKPGRNIRRSTTTSWGSSRKV